jgi:hypothetical protein
MATAKPTKQRATPDLGALIEIARAALQRDGAVKVAKLGPAAVRAEVVAALVKDGFEATKSAVRRPVGEQLAAALADGAFISLKTVGAHVVGATAAEGKKAALALVSAGRARLVVRGAEEVLVPASTAVLSREQVARLVRFSKVAAKAAASKSGAALLESDVIEALQEVVPSLASARGEAALVAGKLPGDARGKLATLLSAVDETRDARTGLSFVPAIVAKLSPSLGSDATSRLLVEAATEGVIELRPEGGLGRLSEQELAVCPPGPQGTRLSWARRLGEVEAR